MTRVTDLQRVDRALYEDQLLRAVVDLAHLRRWLVYHVRRSDRAITQGDAGFPDLVMARPPRLVLAELKRETEVLGAEQRRWLEALGPLHDVVQPDHSIRRVSAAGVEYYTWRPSDWRLGLVDTVLA
jgi:hypothetical protein